MRVEPGLTRAGPWASVTLEHVADRYLTLKDMIRGSGCTPRTVRYYERQGLLRAQRSAGGHRLFAHSELERLSFIISLREAGWSLDEVTAFLDARELAETDKAAAEALEMQLAEQVGRLERKIHVLERLRADLQGTAQLLPVCLECTEVSPEVECQKCARVPSLGDLPRSFRLIWRARELDAGGAAFDEVHSDGGDEDAEELEVSPATGSQSR